MSCRGRRINAKSVGKGKLSMGRDQSSLKNLNNQSEPEKPVLKSETIEPEEAADAQSRQRLIGKELRRWYDSIVKEPVPDDLLDVLHKIDSRSKSYGAMGQQ